VDEEQAVTENATARLSFYQRNPTLCLCLCVFIGFPGLGWLWLTLSKTPRDKGRQSIILKLLQASKPDSKDNCKLFHLASYRVYFLNDPHDEASAGYLAIPYNVQDPVYYRDSKKRIHSPDKETLSRDPQRWPIVSLANERINKGK
jgi:hypothetical protein